MAHIVTANGIRIGRENPLVLIAGPCVIESENHLLTVGSKLKNIAARHHTPFILKASFDKANRTSLNSYRGPGYEKGIQILDRVKNKLNVPILSDVHEVHQVKVASTVLDILQIPALLSRQTDLIVASAKTKKPVNIKKGQFMAPRDLQGAIEKVKSAQNPNILLTERGTFFGYNDIVADMRSLVLLRGFGYPVVFDASHTVQKPSSKGSKSGGERKYIPYLARAAAAVGIDALYLEIHDHPSRARSDGPNMLKVDDLDGVLHSVIKIHQS